MAELLFPQFLADPTQYHLAEKSWESLWHHTIQQVGQSTNWLVPWVRPEYADGSPCRDGNPIFSAVDERNRLGVRVIQHDMGSGDDTPLDWWIDGFGEPPNNIQSLVVSCVLSQENLVKVGDLWRDWIRTGQVPANAANAD